MPTRYSDSMTTLEQRDLMDELARLEQAYASAGKVTLNDPSSPVGMGWVRKDGRP